MDEKMEKMKPLFEMDEIAEDGVYITEPTEEDLKAFAEHAKKRIEEKNKMKAL